MPSNSPTPRVVESPMQSMTEHPEVGMTKKKCVRKDATHLPGVTKT
jgi:hypothetical protein